MSFTNEANQIDVTNSSPESNYRKLLILITILLIILILFQAYQVFTTTQQNKLAEERALAYQTRVDEAQELVSKQQTLILNMYDDYEEIAYGINVDRIVEQQLIATEFTLQALQVLAIQNSQIIELLATAP